MTGTKAGDYAYVPLGWQGTLPAGIEKVETPTSLILVMGRVQTNGPSDYENVHKIQDEYALGQRIQAQIAMVQRAVELSMSGFP